MKKPKYYEYEVIMTSHVIIDAESEEDAIEQFESMFKNKMDERRIDVYNISEGE
jgi:hypothetical protein